MTKDVWVVGSVAEGAASLSRGRFQDACLLLTCTVVGAVSYLRGESTYPRILTREDYYQYGLFTSGPVRYQYFDSNPVKYMTHDVNPICRETARRVNSPI
jgi:hypothetical protein